jgi:two-component system, sensor histidine kinase
VRFWRDLSVASKLYAVIGTMAVLIAAELLTVRFAMGTLSAVRAFVGGEGTWSKSQKNAAFHIQRFGLTRSEEDFAAFLKYLEVPEGDHQARLELIKPNPNMARVREGFLKGQIHPQDIDPMVELLRRFNWEPHIARAIQVWADADEMLERFKEAGLQYHSLLTGSHKPSEAQAVLATILDLNDKLTLLEDEFSAVLGEGSRWLESIIFTLLFLAVLTVEGIGLTLTFLTSRSISRGLNEINSAAGKIGQGDFSVTLPVRSRDEIGTLSSSINDMGKLLERSYKDLEVRVAERTRELSSMAAENERLYKQAAEAVKSRDEFMSIATHELKSPLTSQYLQLQMLSTLIERGLAQPDKIKDLVDRALAQSVRLSKLSEELMDLTRLRIGKLEVTLQNCDLVKVVYECVSQIAADAARAGCTVSVEAPTRVVAMLDSLRMGQVVTNLLSNAIKYGKRQPIVVRVLMNGQRAVIEVQDSGVGIPPAEHARIFERFHRVNSDHSILGLGLGLYITHQIVLAHQGEISVQSEAGKGSLFRVDLPVA